MKLTCIKAYQSSGDWWAKFHLDGTDERGHDAHILLDGCFYETAAGGVAFDMSAHAKRWKSDIDRDVDYSAPVLALPTETVAALRAMTAGQVNELFTCPALGALLRGHPAGWPRVQSRVIRPA